MKTYAVASKTAGTSASPASFKKPAGSGRVFDVFNRSVATAEVSATNNLFLATYPATQRSAPVR